MNEDLRKAESDLNRSVAEAAGETVPEPASSAAPAAPAPRAAPDTPAAPEARGASQ
jgi:hypothetical protein